VEGRWNELINRNVEEKEQKKKKKGDVGMRSLRYVHAVSFLTHEGLNKFGIEQLYDKSADQDISQNSMLFPLWNTRGSNLSRGISCCD
jgi:hypothetical protein